MLRIAKTLLSAQYAHMLEYRAEIFLWALAGSLPIIFLGVWLEASQGGNFGLSPEQFARYFLGVMLVRQFTTVWVIWDFEKEIIEGTLSFKLLQSLDPVWHHVSLHLAEKMTRIPLIFVFFGLFFGLYPQSFWIPSFGQVVLFILSLVMVFTLRFLIQYTFAMMAFWTERASSIEQCWHLFYQFLSGLIAPLEVFPDVVRNLVLITPFPYLVHFPSAILTGLPVNIPQGFLVMFAWCAFFYFCNRWLWKKGLKQYSGMGA